jgi:hypothetical protein
MERRAFERITANVDVRFYCCGTLYSGTAKNLSENGMLIETEEIHFPFDLEFEIILASKENILHVPVNLSRIITSPDSHDCIGVKLLNQPLDYLEFMDDLGTAYKS